MAHKWALKIFAKSAVLQQISIGLSAYLSETAVKPEIICEAVESATARARTGSLAYAKVLHNLGMGLCIVNRNNPPNSEYRHHGF